MACIGRLCNVHMIANMSKSNHQIPLKLLSGKHYEAHIQTETAPCVCSTSSKSQLLGDLGNAQFVQWCLYHSNTTGLLYIYIFIYLCAMFGCHLNLDCSWPLHSALFCSPWAPRHTPQHKIPAPETVLSSGLWCIGWLSDNVKSQVSATNLRPSQTCVLGLAQKDRLTPKSVQMQFLKGWIMINYRDYQSWSLSIIIYYCIWKRKLEPRFCLKTGPPLNPKNFTAGLRSQLKDTRVLGL